MLGAPLAAWGASGGCAAMQHMGLDVTRDYYEVIRPSAGGPQPQVCAYRKCDCVQVPGLVKSMQAWSWVGLCVQVCLSMPGNSLQVAQPWPLATAALARLTLLLRYHSLRNGVWIVEQPSTTLMWRHPRFQGLLEDGKARSLPTVPCCGFRWLCVQ